MIYRVIKVFTDLQDNEHKYHTGDIFPRDGYVASAERIKELSTSKNRRGCPLIEEIIDPKPEHIEDAPASDEAKEVEKPKSKNGNTKPRKKTDVK